MTVKKKAARENYDPADEPEAKRLQKERMAGNPIYDTPKKKAAK